MKKSNRFNKWLRSFALKTLFPLDQNRAWIPVVNESFLGAFQTDNPISLSSALSHPTVYACISQIAYDIGKLNLRLMQKSSDGILNEVYKLPYSKVLKKPNKFQTRQKFIETWMVSLLTNGNTYILKVRNSIGQVTDLYVLDPVKVEPLISDSGDVFYRLKKDDIATVNKDIEAVPASEIIHDTMICLFHPLIGVSPLYAANLATSQALSMQRYSANFFANNAQPSGVLTAPGHIKEETVLRIREAWKEKYSGDNAGKIAVLGDGLTYMTMGSSAVDSELIKQLGWSDEKICSVYKVPPYKIHVDKPPTYAQSETLDRKYYSDCLQRHIESIEALLDIGLEVPSNHETEFDLDDLMRMDLALKMKTTSEGVKGGIFAPNEGRKKFNLKPTEGGDTPYLQQQNYSLSALNERDRNHPFERSSQNTDITVSDEDIDKMKIELQRKSDLNMKRIKIMEDVNA